VTEAIDIAPLNVQPASDAPRSGERPSASKRHPEEEITTANDSGSIGKKLKE
jgi:hypothetical protein